MIFFPRKSSRYEQLFSAGAFAIIMILSVAHRLKYFMPARLWPDEALYAWIGERLFHHPELLFTQEIAGYHPPLFGLVLALNHFFFPPEVACRFTVFIINILGVALIFALGSRLKNTFVGSLAALLLSFNFIYFFQTNFILLDAPLTVMFILLGLALFRLRDDSVKGDHLLVGLTAATILLLKWSGIIAVPVIIAYYLAAFGAWSWKTRLKGLALALWPVIIALLILWLAGLKPVTIALKGDINPDTGWFYFKHFSKIIGFPAVYVAPVLLLGVMGSFFASRKAGVLLLVWGVVLFGAMSLAGEKLLRYILPVLPAIFLLLAIGIDAALCFIFQSKKLHMARAVILIICLFQVFTIKAEYEKKLPLFQKHYSGFRSAGEAVRHYYRPGTTVFAGSPRAIRYYSKLNFNEFGGPIEKIPSAEVLSQRLSTSQRPAILVTDVWEYTQPSWIYPLTEESREQIEAAGLKLKEVVFISERGVKYPIIWIYVTPSLTDSSVQ